MNTLDNSSLKEQRAARVVDYHDAIKDHLATIKNKPGRAAWTHSYSEDTTITTTYEYKDFTLDVILVKPVVAITQEMALRWTLKLRYKNEVISATDYTIQNTSSAAFWNRINHVKKSFKRLITIAIKNLDIIQPDISSKDMNDILNAIDYRGSAVLTCGLFALYTSDRTLYNRVF